MNTHMNTHMNTRMNSVFQQAATQHMDQIRALEARLSAMEAGATAAADDVKVAEEKKEQRKKTEKLEKKAVNRLRKKSAADLLSTLAPKNPTYARHPSLAMLFNSRKVGSLKDR